MSAAHEVLGVPVGATAADIKKAYRRLSRQHHPDTLPPNASTAERKAAAHRFSTINSAYEQLSPEKQQQQRERQERQEQERRQQKKQAQEQQKKQQAQEERERQERERQESERQERERQERERQESERQERERQERERRQRARQQQERQGQGQEQQGQGQEQQGQGQGSTGPAGFIPLWMRERLAQAALNVGEVVAQQGEAAVRDLGHTGVDKGVDYLRRLFSPKL